MTLSFAFSPSLPGGYDAGMKGMVYRVFGLRQDNSYSELKRCDTRESAVMFRKSALETGEFTHVLIAHVPGNVQRTSAHSSTAPE